MTEHLDILVIGAGQAGLATGYFLSQRGVSFTVLDRHSRIGNSWRERYDSLLLFSSRARTPRFLVCRSREIPLVIRARTSANFEASV